MRWTAKAAAAAAALHVAVGCGRLGFDAATDATPAGCDDPDLGHDEDGDGVGDACDLCPATPDRGQANSDGDGVGDACDPRPTTPGDEIAYFVSFEDGELPAGFATLGSATLAPAVDALEVDATSPWLLTSDAVVDATAFEVTMGIEFLATQSANTTVSVVSGLSPDGQAGQRCGAELLGGDPVEHSYAYFAGGEGQDGISVPYPEGLMPGLAYRVALRQLGVFITCTSEVVPGGELATVQTNPPYEPVGLTGVRIRGARLRLTYVFAVHAP